MEHFSPGRRNLSATPQLSVIVASFAPPSSVARCLESLLAQDSKANEVEIIVVCGGREAEFEQLKARFSGVQFLFLPATATLPQVLGQGIARARGDILAVTDAACTAGADWVSAILEAHKSGPEIIGGAVEMAKNARALDVAAFFCEYGQFLPPLPAGESAELPGNNFSFKRQLLEKSPQWVRPEFWKTYWCRALQQEGVALYSTPSIQVSLHKSYRLAPFLRRRFHHGRCFAGMRLNQISTLQRACYLLGSPLLPFIFAARIFRAVWPKFSYRRQWLRALPFSALAILFWCCGEFWGYLTGPGQSCLHVRG